MRPRAHHNRIEGIRIVRPDAAVGGERTLRIFRVVPATDRQDGSLDVFQMRCDVA